MVASQETSTGTYFSLNAAWKAEGCVFRKNPPPNLFLVLLGFILPSTELTLCRGKREGQLPFGMPKLQVKVIVGAGSAPQGSPNPLYMLPVPSNYPPWRLPEQ